MKNSKWNIFKALTGATLLLSAMALPAGAEASGGGHPRDTYPVIIGGAGFAGISAAKELEARGVDFIILEASGRVGGRMAKFEFGEDPEGNPYILEKGANWIQGTVRNPVWDLKKLYGLQGESQNWDDVTVYDNDGSLIEKPYHPVEDPAGAEADAAYVGAGEISARCIQPDDPSEQTPADLNFCMEKIPGYLGAIPNDDLSNFDAQFLFNGFVADTPLKRLYEYYSQDFEWAESPDITSVRFTLPANSYNDFNDADLFVRDDRGYEWLVQSYGAEYLNTSVKNDDEIVFDPADSRLRLHHKIVKVKYDPNNQDPVEVTVCKTNPDNTCDISQPLETIMGAYFIPTFSLGVLQQSIADQDSPPAVPARYDSAPEFDPPISGLMRDAIENYPMALYSKIFFQFEHKFWDDTSMILSAAGDGTDAPIWQSLDLPNQNQWLPDSKILFVTVTGEKARDLHENKTDLQVQQEMIDVLNDIYGERIMELYNGNLLTTADVKDFSMTRWTLDPLYRGMYTNWRVDRTLDQQEEYRKPRGNLWMSGEGTCFRYNGYVHGGMLGGKRTALNLLFEEYGFTDIDTTSICDVVPDPGNSSDAPHPTGNVEGNSKGQNSE